MPVSQGESLPEMIAPSRTAWPEAAPTELELTPGRDAQSGDARPATILLADSSPIPSQPFRIALRMITVMTDLTRTKACLGRAIPHKTMGRDSIHSEDLSTIASRRPTSAAVLKAAKTPHSSLVPPE